MPRHWSRSRSQVSEERGSESGGMSQGQILIPELVDIHPIAASLWNVIAALPTLLYRYAYLVECGARTQEYFDIFCGNIIAFLFDEIFLTLVTISESTVCYWQTNCVS